MASPFVQGQSQSSSKAYKVVYTPTSLTSLITYVSSSCLGSSHADLLDVSLTHQAHFHLRALLLVIPSAYNSLPANIHKGHSLISFKSLFKYLLTEFYFDHSI